MIKKIVLICLVLIVIVGCKQATVGHDAAYEEAISCIEDAKYDEAYKKMIALAGNGHARAQYHVGWMYFNGVGTEQDVQVAFNWYEKSAKLGEDLALAALGSFYVNGMSVEIDCRKGIDYLERAARAGNKHVYKTLAVLYSQGQCVNINIELEKKYYQLYVGSGVASDFETGQMLFWGIGIDRDRKKGIRLMESDYKNHIPDAGYVLGVAYSNGYGTKPDANKAYRYFLESAIAGNTASQYNVGVLLYNGKGVKTDKDKALKWVMKAANKSEINALTFIGYLYEVGEMLERDPAKARDYYQKASLLGGESARKRLEAIQ
ncbi:MAG: sel1 repeat family protein [Pseudodesulfovibrio sp.]|nr:sel1 repeat family protein [Pseudodesulfovibrio sp.]